MMRALRVVTLAACTALAGTTVAPVPSADARSKEWRGDWNGGGKHWRGGGRHHRGSGCWNCGWNGGWWGPAFGFGAGLVIGSLLVQPRYYAAPRAYYVTPAPVNRIAYCKAKFRSYNVATRTYLGFDGRRHYC